MGFPRPFLTLLGSRQKYIVRDPSVVQVLNCLGIPHLIPRNCFFRDREMAPGKWGLSVYRCQNRCKLDIRGRGSDDFLFCRGNHWDGSGRRILKLTDSLRVRAVLVVGSYNSHFPALFVSAARPQLSEHLRINFPTSNIPFGCGGDWRHSLAGLEYVVSRHRVHAPGLPFLRRHTSPVGQ